MSLLQAFLDEAKKRSLILPTQATLSAEDCFFLVRNMPYKRASNREPLTTLKEWRGTCSGKHYFLKAVYDELRIKTRLMACTLYMDADIIQRLPRDVQKLFSSTPIPDVHNYLLVSNHSREVIVDATWPPETEAYGLKINQKFDLEKDMHLSCEPIKHFEVPDDIDPQDFKDSLLSQTFTKEELKQRDLFFSLLTG